MRIANAWAGVLVVLLSMGAANTLAQVANGNAKAGAPGAPAPVPAGVPISRDAQRAYRDARDKLVQIRTVLRTSDTQSSTGSGFFVSADGLIITNFHVASQLALEPDRYRAVVVAVDGKEEPVQLLAFDVRHDLALLRLEKPGAGRGALAFRDQATPLARGERIFSLGNPRDIGFAVTEGAYNGLAHRSFYPRIFFGGTVNPGMSGGPVLDDHGSVVGVNVSKRRDGEQLSFLIPAEFAQNLLVQAKDAKPMDKPAYAELTRQLLVHQEEMTRRFAATPLKGQRHNGYLVPVPQDSLARCWGGKRDADFKAFDLERTNCQLDSHLYAGDATTGYIKLRHESYDAPRLGALRFASLHAQSFANENFAVQGSRKMSGAECHERFIDRSGMAMRAVVCANAYRKLPGLYDVSVLVASLNRSTQGVQGRLDARGVSFANGMKLVAQYLEGFKWEPIP